MRRFVRYGILPLALPAITLILAACGSSPQATAGKSPAKTTVAKTAPKATSKPSPTAASKPMACAQPCVVADDMTLTVSSIQYGWSDPNGIDTPDPGNTYVVLQITVVNHGSSSYNLNPDDFTLQDASGIRHSSEILVDDQATEWSPVDLTKGASQTETLAFQARANEPHGLILRWQPDLLGPVYQVKLS